MIDSVSASTTGLAFPMLQADSCPACGTSPCSCHSEPVRVPTGASAVSGTSGATPAAPESSSGQADPHGTSSPASSSSSTSSPNTAVPGNRTDQLALSVAEKEAVQELEQRDREVRSHEQAHISAGGQYVTGGATYTFQTGPDNRQYAVGGQVRIDTAPVPGDPDATMEKARTVRRAALAPSQPSAEDQQVAAQAAMMEAEAQLEKSRQRDGEPGEKGIDGRNLSDHATEPERDATGTGSMSIVEEAEALREEREQYREGSEPSAASDSPRLVQALTAYGVARTGPDNPPDRHLLAMA